MRTRLTTPHHTRYGGIRNTFGDFVCLYCRNYVSTDAGLSGVRHRNHCPYCLSSRHLDLYEAGDRLSACKARMAPVGLTLKQTIRKYASEDRGELMLIHQCEACAKVSINRIAADDDAESIFRVYEASQWMDLQTRTLLAEGGIIHLSGGDAELVYRRLYGQRSVDVRLFEKV